MGQADGAACDHIAEDGHHGCQNIYLEAGSEAIDTEQELGHESGK